MLRVCVLPASARQTVGSVTGEPNFSSRSINELEAYQHMEALATAVLSPLLSGRRPRHPSRRHLLFQPIERLIIDRGSVKTRVELFEQTLGPGGC